MLFNEFKIGVFVHIYSRGRGGLFSEDREGLLPPIHFQVNAITASAVATAAIGSCVYLYHSRAEIGRLLQGMPNRLGTELTNGNIKKGLLSTIQGIGVFAVAGLVLRLGSNLAHEMGHAMTTKVLYEDFNPQVHVEFLGSNSYCYYDSSPLSLLGEYLGPKVSSAVLAASGPLMESLFNVAALSLVCRAPLKIGIPLLCALIDNEQSLIKYALRAPSSDEHDFGIIDREMGSSYGNLLRGACVVGALPVMYVGARCVARCASVAWGALQNAFKKA